MFFVTWFILPSVFLGLVPFPKRPAPLLPHNPFSFKWPFLFCVDILSLGLVYKKNTKNTNAKGATAFASLALL